MMDFVQGQTDPENPPAKRPCLDPLSAATNIADPTIDEGSDFYNTPLNAGTPVHTAEATLRTAEDSVTSQSATPQKSRPKIPGLTLCDGSDNDLPLPLPQHDEPRETNCAGSYLRQVVTATADAPGGEFQNNIFQSTSEVDIGIHDTKTNAVHETDASTGDGVADKQEWTSNSAAVADVTMPVAEEAVHDATQPNINEHAVSATNAEEQGEPEWEADSSPYESSSTSDTSDTLSSDDSDSDSDDEDDEEGTYELLQPEEQAQLLMAAEGASDDEAGGKDTRKAVRTANETEEEPPQPIPDITITADTKVEMLGNVESIVGNVVLIKANISGEYQVLESGSVLCLANLSILGVVSETLGKVEQPMYTVRFSSAAAVNDSGIEKGVPVFYVVDHSYFVFTQPLKGLKGSDASNFHDEEVGEDEMEFSDDEAEAEYKRQLKQKRQQKKDAKTGNRKGYGEQGPGPSGLRNSELNYDDVDMADGYTPLARPKDLHEMMSFQEPPLEQGYPHTEKSFRGGRGRGRGRGHDRGGRASYRARGRGHQHRNDRDQEYTVEQNRPSGSFPPTANQNHAYYQGMQQQQQQQQQQQLIPPYIQPFSGHAPLQQPHQPQQSGVYPNLSSAMQYSPQAFPFAQPLQQQRTPPFPPPGSHINPAFFANVNQNSQQAPPQPSESQGSGDTFAAAQAQLDLLRRLSRGNS